MWLFAAGNGDVSRRYTCTTEQASTQTSSTLSSHHQTTTHQGHAALTRLCSKIQSAVGPPTQPRLRPPTPSARTAARPSMATRSATRLVCTGTQGIALRGLAIGQRSVTVRGWRRSLRPTARCWGRCVEVTTCTRVLASPVVAAQRCLTPKTTYMDHPRRSSTMRWMRLARKPSPGLRWWVPPPPICCLLVALDSSPSSDCSTCSF